MRRLRANAPLWMLPRRACRPVVPLHRPCVSAPQPRPPKAPRARSCRPRSAPAPDALSHCHVPAAPSCLLPAAPLHRLRVPAPQARNPGYPQWHPRATEPEREQVREGAWTRISDLQFFKQNFRSSNIMWLLVQYHVVVNYIHNSVLGIYKIVISFNDSLSSIFNHISINGIWKTLLSYA
jgi:hypothetical protein